MKLRPIIEIAAIAGVGLLIPCVADAAQLATIDNAVNWGKLVIQGLGAGAATLGAGWSLIGGSVFRDGRAVPHGVTAISCGGGAIAIPEIVQQSLGGAGAGISMTELVHFVGNGLLF